MELNMSERERLLPVGAGKSSFALVDADALFEFLPLEATTAFLDIACGNGAYTFAASERIGPKGRLYALDLWEKGITLLQKEAEKRGIKNLQSAVGDATQKIPLEDACVDLCFMASVLHDFVHIQGEEAVLAECARVLKPGGKLAVVEFKKIDGPPGPPCQSRMTPGDVETLLTSQGFTKEREGEVGPYHYAILFHRPL
jgi:ubiquinone/menaquinone biosynthesis C-methylase UbiE